MTHSLSAADVARAMERYDVRRGNNPLPRYLGAVGGNPVMCFDKGHFRQLNPNDLNPAGDFTIIEGRRVELNRDVSALAGVRLPVGFVAVPEQHILEHFSTRYSRNIRKMQRAILQHLQNMNVFGGQMLMGNSIGRPRRPTVQSLNLDTPTEFERFLQPLQSFHHLRLRMSFDRLVREAEDGNNPNVVYQNLDFLNLPDLVNNLAEDQAALTRWNVADQRYIAVRIDNFDVFEPAGAPVRPNPGPPLAPVVRAMPANNVPAAGVQGVAVASARERDEQMLENCRLGRSSRWRGEFIYMEPWKDAFRVKNPFESREYQFAYAFAQNEFVSRHLAFKTSMDAKRRAHATQWRQYSAYRNEMRSVFMLDNKRNPVNADYAGVERPQVEHFTKEWRKFAFDLRQEMKNFRFLPITPVAGAVAPNVPGFNFTDGIMRNPYVDISERVLQSAHKMFLI